MPDRSDSLRRWMKKIPLEEALEKAVSLLRQALPA